MREKMIFIDLVIMAIILSLLILNFIAILFEIPFFLLIFYLCLILYYYSIIKSIMGIILFIKNIIQKNILILSKKILFLFIPSLLLIIYIVNFVINYFPIFLEMNYKFLSRQIIIESIILVVGCLALLCYCILNKTLSIKKHNKIILAIIIPISYFLGYCIKWATVIA
jgi:hypothetical protein